ncbi:hypothetical protein D9615_000519 [Tricholomella constricta]|uniref:Uncharacterized protein n=1 Tax=Tricholomella constricta TaxID=117010 RepID=A0A8H5MC37_9AGAR|nr:hypothetical protein D9615_000519 [Tricholomella constricta]
MSIFTRPQSPPPRQPSPELAYTPLPVRARQRTTSSQHSSSSYAPATPPGLTLKRPYRPVLSVRSCDHLHQRAQEHTLRNTRTRSTLTASPPATPRSLPSPSRSQFNESPSHRRTLSNAIPYRSPPPSPTIAVPPPPVPPIPAFVLSPPAQIKSAHCPQPVVIMPIHLPDLANLSPLDEPTHATRTRKHTTPPSPHKPYVSPDKHRSMGMTCLKFFFLRNSKPRGPQASEA